VGKPDADGGTATIYRPVVGLSPCCGKDSGLFVAAMGNTAVEAQFSSDWLGAPMYWSHFDSQTNQRLLQESHLHILSAREETAEEDGVPVTFLWVVAQKPLL
jgi:hypothetical protein